jgi:hypothetical protein
LKDEGGGHPDCTSPELQVVTLHPVGDVEDSHDNKKRQITITNVSASDKLWLLLR